MTANPHLVRTLLEQFRRDLDVFVEAIPLSFEDKDAMDKFRASSMPQRLHLKTVAEKELKVDFSFELAKAQERVKEKRISQARKEAS